MAVLIKKFRPEQVVGGSKTRIQLAVLISLEYCSFKCRPNCILLVRALVTDAYAHEVWFTGYMIGRCTLSKFTRSRGYSVQPSVATMKLQSMELFCLPLPPAKPPDNHDKCLLILVETQHMILVQLCLVDKMTSTEALEKGDCQHLISTKACNLLLDKGYLKWHIIHGEIN